MGFYFPVLLFLFILLRGILVQDKPIQVCGAKLYESGSIKKDQDFLSPKILLSAFSDQKDYEVNFGYEALLCRVALKSGACDKFCSMWPKGSN